MKVQDLRAKSDDELRGELLELQRAVFNLRMQKGIGQLLRPNQLRSQRRDIARLKTILTERKRT